MRVRIAVLDMDGTLFRGTLAAHMAEALTAIPGGAGVAAQEAVRAIGHYQAGQITHDELSHLFYDAYARAVRGLPSKQLRQIAAAVWRHNRSRLFPHASSLALLIRNRGLMSCLISGSPDEVITLAAQELQFDRWWGLTIAARGGTSTGQVLRAPARRGGKSAVLAEFSARMDVDWAGSFAIGDSSADIEILDVVGVPVAFEPDPQLRREAERRGWTIAHRGNVLRHCGALLTTRN